MGLGACPPSIPHSQLRFLTLPCFRVVAKTTEGNGDLAAFKRSEDKERVEQ